MDLKEINRRILDLEHVLRWPDKGTTGEDLRRNDRELSELRERQSQFLKVTRPEGATSAGSRIRT